VRASRLVNTVLLVSLIFVTQLFPDALCGNDDVGTREYMPGSLTLYHLTSPLFSKADNVVEGPQRALAYALHSSQSCRSSQRGPLSTKSANR
jgi:hypothetical protein